MENTISKPKISILVQSASHNKLHAMVSIISTTISLGGDIYLLLTHEALKSYLLGTMDSASIDFADLEYKNFYENAIEDEKIASISELLEASKQKGNVSIYGCQASILLWRKYTEEHLSKLTAIIGHSTFLLMSNNRQLLFI